MRTITFQIDYEYCPQGHTWTFIPSSTLYPDVFWCEECKCFYNPTVEKVVAAKLNERFSSDRAGDLIKYARFLRWKAGLSMGDMPSDVVKKKDR